MNELEKAQKAAEVANAKLAELRSIEDEKAAHKAAERAERQREKDAEFLAQWETLDAELQAVGSKSAADAVYEGTDPITAVAVFWIQRAKRNAVRQHAREAYFRLHGKHPDDAFARELSYRDMAIASKLESAIDTAAGRHAADLADELDAKWLVPDGE